MAVSSALEAEGLQVRRDAEIPEELEDCGDGSCVATLLTITQTELAAGITIWARPDANTEPGELVVGLIDEDGVSYNGTANVGEGGLSAAATDAVHQAHARLIVGPGPFLLVNGTPFGASVFIDDELMGGLPWNGRVEPGQHEVRVERQGFTTQTHTVQIPDDVTANETLEVTLVSSGGTASGGGIAEWALPTGIAALIVGLGIGSACPRSARPPRGVARWIPASGCADFIDQLSVSSAIAWAIAGGVLAIGGVTLIILAATEDTSGASVRARFSPNYASLEGTFQ